MCKTQPKPFRISKREVWEAYQRVKANQGAAGVDGQSIAAFETRRRDNLYRIWNRLSSGSYVPPPVRREASGQGVRTLGIPTVSDRIAQMVVKQRLEPLVEPHFHPDSYGYRPGKSALEAVGVARQRCWRADWVLDLDIKGFFDAIPHALLLRAVRKHVTVRWLVLYIERWLTAPMQDAEGTLRPRPRGTPQGGVVSPLLANLFLHYAFDVWMRRQFPAIPCERYADDIIVYCRTEAQAQAHAVRAAIADRLATCGLTLHPDKTKVVYGKDSNRRGTYPVEAFDFLGFTFRPRRAKDRYGRYFTSFSPAISRTAATEIRATLRRWQLHRRSGTTLEALSTQYNPVVRGWLQYYGRYGRSAINSVMRQLEYALVRWAVRKYKHLRGHQRRAAGWLKRRAQQHPGWFAHWELARWCGQSTVGAG